MGISVLGSFPEYVKVSDDLGARRFDIGEAWSALPDEAAQWEANRYFLDSMLSADDTFVWSTDPRSARPGSWFFREVRYLRSKGKRSPTRKIWV